jgi:GNAT superfamily N-acetyltransferase
MPPVIEYVAAAMTEPRWSLRAAEPADVTAIADVWHRGWRDGHLGHVPAGLHAHRTPESFADRVPRRLATTVVASQAALILGFVMVHADELEQLYVAEASRGTGVAAALLAAGEQRIAKDFALAWLAVVAGNERARSFYARHGWRDAGASDYVAETLGGTFVVPVRRYEKPLQR